MAPEPGRGDDPLGLIEELFSGSIAGRPFGEPVSIGAHMRQTAARAQADRAVPSLVAAALLHDIAFVIAPDLTDESAIEIDHAEVGAAWLARWFPPSVSEPVRLHVEAKRYLAAVEPGYSSTLSAESTRTLALQGGPMAAAEIRRFQSYPFGSSAIELRRLDELAKDPRFEPPPIAHFLAVVRGVLVPS
jgi:gamma-butyrobetaine dioxygenase